MKTYDDQFISMEHILLAAIDIDETMKRFVEHKKRSDCRNH